MVQSNKSNVPTSSHPSQYSQSTITFKFILLQQLLHQTYVQAIQTDKTQYDRTVFDEDTRVNTATQLTELRAAAFLGNTQNNAK